MTHKEKLHQPLKAPKLDIHVLFGKDVWIYEVDDEGMTTPIPGYIGEVDDRRGYGICACGDEMVWTWEVDIWDDSKRMWFCMR